VQSDLLFSKGRKADLKQGFNFDTGIKEVNGESFPHYKMRL